MSNIIEMIKKIFFGKNNTEVKLLESPNNDGKGKSISFFERLKNSNNTLSPSQEIEKALERYRILAEKNIILNAAASDFDHEHFQAIRDEGAKRRKDASNRSINEEFFYVLNFGLKAKAEEILIELYEKDPTILDEDRKDEVIEIIENQSEVNSEGREKTFKEWAIEHLDSKSLNKYRVSRVNLRNVIESVMPVDDFIKLVIEDRINATQTLIKNASVIGEEFGISYAMSRAINPNCELPEELREEYSSTEDYQKKRAEQLQKYTNQAIEDGTLSKGLMEFRKKFADSQLFAKNAIYNYSLDEYEKIIESIVEQDEKNGNVNKNVTKLDMDIMHAYMVGLWNGAHSISDNNHENTYFQKYDGERYQFYKGNVPKKKKEHQPEL